MDTSKKKTVGGKEKPTPRCLQVAAKGISTSNDFARLMSCLMSDLIEGSVNPVVGNAVCNAGAKLLKVVEMSYRYGNGKGMGNLNLVESTQPNQLTQ